MVGRPLLVVDLDDTLIRSRSDRAALLMKALDDFGVSVEHDRLDVLWGQPFRQLVIGLAPDVEPQYDDFVASYCEALRHTPPTLCPGVAAATGRLGAVFRCVVHTASHSRVACTDLVTASLDGCVDEVFGSDRQSNPKPDAHSGLELMTSLGHALGPPAGSCYIGDALTDLAIAESGQLTMVAVSYGAATREQWLAAGVREERIARTFDSALDVAWAVASHDN